MPRAYRVSCQGLVWHITHRCHQKAFLLKFVCDRRRWRHWLFEARRRYGLCVLNYIVTSNHIHLLALDQGRSEIAQSIQLVAGRTAQEYNRRKKRHGAFWEDRYHATAVQTGAHLVRCLSYIDLNMVRAGVVSHPKDWEVSGYHEIQSPRQRKGIIDHGTLCRLVGIPTIDDLRNAHDNWIDDATERKERDPVWSESVAVGNKHFLADVKEMLGAAGLYRQIFGVGDTMQLKDNGAPYDAHFSAKIGQLAPADADISMKIR